jgi:uncharacterized membrane protein
MSAPSTSRPKFLKQSRTQNRKGIIIKLLLLVLAIIVFVVTAILALTGGTWSTTVHLFALLGIGLALFAASFLPLPAVGP